MAQIARAIAEYLYEETNKNATSMTYAVPFEVIAKEFYVNMDDEKLHLDIRDAMNEIDNVINIDIDEIRKHIVVMIYGKKPIKQKIVELPVCYVHMIQDCLEAVKKHNLISLIYGKGMTEDEKKATMSDLQEVLDNFITPLDELDQDTKIIID